MAKQEVSKERSSVNGSGFRRGMRWRGPDRVEARLDSSLHLPMENRCGGARGGICTSCLKRSLSSTGRPQVQVGSAFFSNDSTRRLTTNDDHQAQRRHFSNGPASIAFRRRKKQDAREVDHERLRQTAIPNRSHAACTRAGQEDRDIHQ